MRGTREKWLRIACCALCCIAFATAAAAAPPAAPSNVNGNSGFLGRATGLLAAPARAAAQHFEFGKLDLRPPDQLPSSHVTERDAPFPSARHTDAAPEAHAEDEVPGLATVVHPMTPVARAQEMARRFQREGLPVARLWQNHAAMLSLGLNQRGKPGLWLIQKVP
jgi:hypothetical protein